MPTNKPLNQARPIEGADMASNTTVLIVVTALAVLVLAGMLVGVRYKTRTPQRHPTDTTTGDEPAEDTLRLRRRQALANE
jgi:hypothetical protein